MSIYTKYGTQNYDTDKGKYTCCDPYSITQS